MEMPRPVLVIADRKRGITAHNHQNASRKENRQLNPICDAQKDCHRKRLIRIKIHKNRCNHNSHEIGENRDCADADLTQNHESGDKPFPMTGQNMTPVQAVRKGFLLNHTSIRHKHRRIDRHDQDNQKNHKKKCHPRLVHDLFKHKIQRFCVRQNP